MSESNEHEITVHLDLEGINELLPPNIDISANTKNALKSLVEREVKEVTRMLLETTAVQGKYTAQDVRQILSLKGFNICY